MSTFFIAWAAVTGWLAASRWLYRRWMRGGTFRVWDEHCCSHGYKYVHQGEACYRDRPSRQISPVAVVAIAMLAATVLPAVLAALWIMHDTPQSPQQVRERIAALERENKELDEQIRKTR